MMAVALLAPEAVQGDTVAYSPPGSPDTFRLKVTDGQWKVVHMLGEANSVQNATVHAGMAQVYNGVADRIREGKYDALLLAQRDVESEVLRKFPPKQGEH